MEEAEASGDAAVRARAMHAAAVAVLPGSEGTEFVRTLRALAEEAGDLEAQYTAVTSLLFRHLIEGDESSIDEALAQLAVIAGKLRSPRFDSALDQHRAMTAAMDGRFAEAEELFFESLGAARRMGNDVMVANTGVGLYQPWREQGRLGDLLEPTRRVAEAPDALPSWRAGLIGLLAEVGRIDRGDRDARGGRPRRRSRRCAAHLHALRAGRRRRCWSATGSGPPCSDRSSTPPTDVHATIAGHRLLGGSEPLRRAHRPPAGRPRRCGRAAASGRG